MGEPQSPMMRGWDAYKQPSPPPKPKPKKGRKFKVSVPPPEAKRQEVVNKLLMSTEALSPEEKKILRGYRISRRDLGMEND